ncbi:MAG: hypothetical protein EKK31_11260 [Hyphomicrobiales bacterium]|jgi:hypothetical protein|nr:MAG: hypothetical protein EKK31_11260 [Hyphomicrobiales bacterium]
MPRHRRRDDISEGHLWAIEQKMHSLDAVLDAASLSLTPFRPHYDAIGALKQQMREAVNLLRDRAIDYQRPHGAPMTGLGLPPPDRRG